jgi:hypothetical protein
MKIHLDENMFVEDDGCGYSLCEFTGKNDKTGNPIFKTINYPSTIEGAVKSYARLKCLSYEDLSIKDYVDRYEKVVKDLMIRIPK